MNNLSSESEARDLTERRIKDPNLRHRYLSILADAIVEANRLDIKQDNSQWAVTTKGGVPRLVVGHYYTYSSEKISRGIVWLALDTDSLEALKKQQVPALKAWQLDPEVKYRHAKDRTGAHNPFSTNGYYDLSSADPSLWPTVEALSFAFIDRALDIGQRLPSTSRRAHSSGILKYMRSELGRQIPDPKS